jgi:hypothetical protein
MQLTKAIIVIVLIRKWEAYFRKSKFVRLKFIIHRHHNCIINKKRI